MGGRTGGRVEANGSRYSRYLTGERQASRRYQCRYPFAGARTAKHKGSDKGSDKNE